MLPPAFVDAQSAHTLVFEDTTSPFPRDSTRPSHNIQPQTLCSEKLDSILFNVTVSEAKHKVDGSRFGIDASWRMMSRQMAKSAAAHAVIQLPLALRSVSPNHHKYEQ
jgi:hypothetical protein